MPNIIGPTTPDTTGSFSPSQLRSNDYGSNDGFLFSRDFNQPTVERRIAYLEPQYFATSLLTRMEGRSIPTSSVAYNWSEQDRTIPLATVSSLSSFGSLTISVTTSGTSASGFAAGDTVMIPSAFDPATLAPRNVLLGKVESISGAVIVLSKEDGTVWAATELTTTGGASKFGKGWMLVGEGSDIQAGNTVYPNYLSNNLGILRKDFKVTGTALITKSWIGGTSEGDPYYYQDRYVQVRNFAREREVYVQFGRRQDGGRTSGEGFMDSIQARGTTSTYTAPMLEADYQNIMDLMAYKAPNKEFLVLAGRSWSSQWHNANKQYALSAGARYIAGETNPLTLAGLRFTTYEFNGVTIHVHTYDLLNDDHVLTWTGNTGLNAYRNWRDSAVFYNLGMNNGVPCFAMRHGAMGSLNRSFTYDERPGVGMNGAMFGGGLNTGKIDSAGINDQGFNGAVSGVDGLEVTMLSHIGPQMSCAHWNGIMHRSA